MNLSVDDQWMMAYMNSRIHRWGDVRDDASRAMKRIKGHQDFIDWSEHFLPASRCDEVKRALVAFKISKAKDKKPKASTPPSTFSVNINEKAAKLLHARAKAEQCSISDLLLKHLA